MVQVSSLCIASDHGCGNHICQASSVSKPTWPWSSRLNGSISFSKLTPGSCLHVGGNRSNQLFPPAWLPPACGTCCCRQLTLLLSCLTPSPWSVCSEICSCHMCINIYIYVSVLCMRVFLNKYLRVYEYLHIDVCMRCVCVFV